MMTVRQQMVACVAAQIVGVRLPHCVRVAIDGVDAAGKTMFAEELADAVLRLGRPVIRASIDGFHNPRAIRRRRGSPSPEGYFEDSFNYPALSTRFCSLSDRQAPVRSVGRSSISESTNR